MTSTDKLIATNLANYKENCDYLDCEIKTEREVIDFLQSERFEVIFTEQATNFIKLGLYLHKKRLQGLLAYRKEYGKGLLFYNKSRLARLSGILYKIRFLLEQHENHVYCDDWKKDYCAQTAEQ